MFDVEMSVSFLEEDAGSFVCFCRDVSERKLAENEIGMQLIELMAQQFDASLELDGSHGTSYTLRFKA